jgi:hypothetical protein
LDDERGDRERYDDTEYEIPGHGAAVSPIGPATVGSPNPMNASCPAHAPTLCWYGPIRAPRMPRTPVPAMSAFAGFGVEPITQQAAPAAPVRISGRCIHNCLPEIAIT